MIKKLYQEIACLIIARDNCLKSNPVNQEWFDKHTDNLEYIERNILPSGSGIDSGCKFNLQKSTRNKIVIDSSFHCMDENGYYDGWIDFTVIIKPNLLSEIDLNIIGKFGKNQDLKDYLYETFSYELTRNYNNNKKELI